MTISPFETDINKLQEIIISVFSDHEKEKILVACLLSRELHGDQRYKEPDELYIPHTFRVPAYLVADFKVRDTDLIIAGLLHDSIEDQAERLATKSKLELRDKKEQAKNALKEIFNDRVAEIVWKLSNPLVYYQAKNVEEKIRLYQENLSEEVKDPAVYCIKLADLIDNWATVNDKVSHERRLYAAKKYVDSFDKFLSILDENKLISSGAKLLIRQNLIDGKTELSKIVQIS